MGVTNHLLTGMILQVVLGQKLRDPWRLVPTSSWQRPVGNSLMAWAPFGRLFHGRGVRFLRCWQDRSLPRIAGIRTLKCGGNLLPVEYLGHDLASQKTSDRHKTLVFWSDELMDDHHLHTRWAHVLDGFCLLGSAHWWSFFYGPCR